MWNCIAAVGDKAFKMFLEAKSEMVGHVLLKNYKYVQLCTSFLENTEVKSYLYK